MTTMLLPNTLYNMNVLDLTKLIPDEYFDCVVTDCPYKIISGGVRVVDLGDETSGIFSKRNYNSKVGIKLTNNIPCSNKWLKKDLQDITNNVKNGKMFSHNEIKFADWLPEIYRVLKKGSHCYIMINGRNLCELTTEAQKIGFVWQNLLTWVKGNLTPNRYYMNGAEYILMLSKRPARNINNMGSSNVIKIPNQIGKDSSIHPTAKPVALMKYLIENSSNEDDIVFEPFAGGGSTLIACKELNRNFIGCEIDKDYYQMALNNLNKSNEFII